jgi:hypothetical protein
MKQLATGLGDSLHDACVLIFVVKLCYISRRVERFRYPWAGGSCPTTAREHLRKRVTTRSSSLSAPSSEKDLVS